MKDVKATDFYETKRMVRIGEDERSYLLDFYAPIAGLSAIALFNALYEEGDNGGDCRLHESLFKKFQLSPGEFFHALEVLEALGLVKTYYMDGKGVHYFVYATYGPKEPSDFLNNVLLKGTLTKYVGKEEVARLGKKYKTPSIMKDFVDVSSSFQDVFHPDYADPAYAIEKVVPTIGQKKSALKTGFDMTALFALLEQEGIQESDFSKQERKDLERYGALYALSPEGMKDLLLHSYHEERKIGERLDFKALVNGANDLEQFPYLQEASTKSELNSDSVMAEKIRMMEKTSPRKWLSLVQDGRPLGQNDQRVINHLFVEMRLPSGVVNALCEYVLERNDNVLDYWKCDELASALNRVGVKTARDAMDYLNSRRSKKKKSGSYRKKDEVQEEEVAPKNEAKDTPKEDKKEIADDISAMLDSIYNK